jgi:hypothetical protein
MSDVEIPEELKDPRLFQKMMWDHVGFPAVDPVASDIAYELYRGPRRQLVMAYREATKTATFVAFAWHALILNPKLRILILSAASAHANNISRWMWSLLHSMPILAHLRPPKDSTHQSATEFKIAECGDDKDPSVVSLGIESNLAGRRADIILLDDIESKKNTETTKLRGRLKHFVLEAENIARNDGKSRIIVAQTPHVEDSIVKDFRDRGYVPYVWPQRFMSAHGLAPSLAAQVKADPTLLAGGGIKGQYGKPTNEERATEVQCQEKELAVGSREYRLQYLLDTSVGIDQRYPLKLRNWIVMDLDSMVEFFPAKVLWGCTSDLELDLPCVGFDGDGYFKPLHISNDYVPYDSAVMFIDPAGTGRDEIGWVVMKLKASQLVVLDYGGLTGGYSDKNLNFLSETAVRWKIAKLRIEDNFGDGMFGKLMLPFLATKSDQADLSIGIESERATTSKGERILDALLKASEQHRLIVNRSAIEREYNDRRPGLSDSESLSYMLSYQYSHLAVDETKTVAIDELPHDDRIDALAMGVNYFAHMMGIDRDREIARRKEDEREKFLKRYAKEAMGTDRHRSISRHIDLFN